MGRRGPGKKAGQDATTDQLLKKLVVEFGSVVDEALILAIASDQDLKDHYDEVRSALSSIAVTAAAEEATGFDPSGLGCSDEGENGQKSPDDIFSASGNGVSTENATTISDSGYGSDKSSKLTEASLSDEEKVDSLLGMFGSSFHLHTVRMILRNANGDLDRAFDELINRQHLADTGQLLTGVDGFYVSDDDERYPRGKGKGRAGRNGKNGKNGKNRLSINYSVVSPVDGEELEGAKGPLLLSPTTSSRPAAAGSKTAEPLPFPVDVRPAPVGFNRVASLQSSATALARQGPLARQGLVVYTERLRDEHQASAARSFQQAQQLVEEQSRHTPLQIDLHGVTVLDGVRIAKHRVQLWWDKLEGNRELKAKRESFTVITGVGRHSANGISRLRQAVGAALRNDGWKYDTLTGSFRVIGRA